MEYNIDMLRQKKHIVHFFTAGMHLRTFNLGGFRLNYAISICG